MWPFRRRPAAVPEAVADVLDQLAQVFAAHSGAMALLLLNHSSAVIALDAVLLDPNAEPHQLAMAAAESKGTREALLTYCTTPEGNR